MKYFLFLVLVFLLHSIAFSQRETIKINGGYKNCNVFKYDYLNGVPDSSSKRLVFSFIYDDNGNVINEVEYSFQDSIQKKENFSYKYDKKWRMIEQICGINDSTTIVLKFKHNSKGDVIETLGIPTNSPYKIYWEKTIKYDKKRNKIEENFIKPYLLDNKGEKTVIKSIFSQSISHLFIYDNNNNKIECRVLTSDGSELRKVTFHYDKNRKLIEMDTRQHGYEATMRDTYKYNIDGNLIENIWYNCLDEPKVIRVYIYEK
jgi:hypothetical protein